MIFMAKALEKITAGEAAGILAAQSLGEPGTQMTLRSFHFAGVAEQVPTGLPRMIEIVDARKEPKRPMIDIYLLPKIAQDEKKVRDMARDIEERLLDDYAYVIENFPKHAVMVRIVEKDIDKWNGDMNEVKRRIKEFGKGYEIKTSGEKVLIRLRKEQLRKIRKFANKLKTLLIGGVKGISKAVIIKDKEGNNFIRASGANLADVSKMPGVDSERVYTNDIQKICEVYGVEAARNAIVKELEQLMDKQGLKVNVRHLMILADAMTLTGDIVSIGRHGLSGQKSSVLARAAFEETVKHIVNAAVMGEEDVLTGVTENILIGQPIPLGSGLVRLKMK